MATFRYVDGRAEQREVRHPVRFVVVPESPELSMTSAEMGRLMSMHWKRRAALEASSIVARRFVRAFSSDGGLEYRELASLDGHDPGDEDDNEPDRENWIAQRAMFIDEWGVP